MTLEPEITITHARHDVETYMELLELEVQYMVENWGISEDAARTVLFSGVGVVGNGNDWQPIIFSSE